jgi:rhodanese-related sulfurtransferase
MLNPFSSLPNVPETDVTHTAQAREGGSAQIVDVREPEEWAEGHIPGAIHIPLGELAARTGELDSGQPAIVVCRSGRRSLYGAETLLQAGFGDAKSLAGGMVDWEAAGQPVER